MAELSELIKERMKISSEVTSNSAKFKEVEYQQKIAIEEENVNKINSCTAEIKVLTKMLTELTDRAKPLDEKIQLMQKELKSEAANYYMYGAFIMAASIAAFFMSLGVGLLWFFGCLIVGYIVQSKSNDKKALAAGLTEDDIKNIKKKVSKDMDNARYEREELAKAIAKEVKK
jgi:hypothetical protein